MIRNLRLSSPFRTTKKGVTTFKAKVPLASAGYNSATQTVTLYPKGALNLSKPEQLTVSAGLLTDGFERPLNGGKNVVITFSTKGVSIA